MIWVALVAFMLGGSFGVTLACILVSAGRADDRIAEMRIGSSDPENRGDAQRVGPAAPETAGPHHPRSAR